MRILLFMCITTMGVGHLGCGEDTRPAEWSYIHEAIIQPSCATANCHSSLTKLLNLDLDNKENAYQGLVGQSCEQGKMGAGEKPGTYVFPGQPENSKLMYQLRGIETRTMPPDLPLPEADILLIEQWILEGAPCN